MATTTDPTSTTTQGGIIVTITNNLSIPVDIYDVYNPATAGQTVPYQYTQLGTLAAGKTSTVTTIRSLTQLQAMYTGFVPELDNKYYYQFPVRIMSGTQSSDGSPLVYTIAETDRLASVQSFLFHKFAMANPDSGLTTNLNAALKTGKADTVNAFFAGTQNYQNCTLAAWNAIMTWLMQFTTGWQGPYYLYENPPSSVPDGYLPKLLATLNILSAPGVNSATLSSCTSDAKGNPVYTTPAQNTTVVMFGNGTLVDANPGAQGDLSFSVTPLWMNVVQTSTQNGVEVPGYVIGSGVCGTLMGTDVVSSQTARQVPGKPADASKQGYFDSLFSSASSTLSTLVGLIMLYQFCCSENNENQAKKESAKKDAKSADDLKAKEDQIDSDTEAEISAKLTSPAATETFNSVPAQVQANAEAGLKAYQAETMTQTMNAQAEAISDQMDALLDDGETPSDAFEAAYSQMLDDFRKAAEQISNGDIDGANATLKEATTNINKTLQNSQHQMEAEESDALRQTANELAEVTQSADELAKNETQSSSEEDEGDGDTETDLIEVDAIEL